MKENNSSLQDSKNNQDDNQNNELNGSLNKNQKQSSKQKSVKKTNISRIGNSINWHWSIRILFLTLALGLLFSTISEFALSGASLVIALIVIFMLLLIATIFDMIGVSVTAGEETPFIAMASRKVKGAKEALVLIRNADKVSSFCCDIIGDICGTLSGAAGAAIAVQIIRGMTNGTATILLSALVSGLIASVTVFAKSIGKGIAINYSNNIMLFVGKVLSVFSK
jgi:hypothetical protein